MELQLISFSGTIPVLGCVLLHRPVFLAFAGALHKPPAAWSPPPGSGLTKATFGPVSGAQGTPYQLGASGRQQNQPMTRLAFAS